MMPLIDERGRLFGAVNLIDLAVLLFVAALIPLGYGAYVMFRTPPPRITSVTPNTLPFTRGTEQRVQITGAHLRPFLRAKIGTSTALSFAIQTADTAEMRFSDQTPGTYDVVLLDESQEIARLANAVTILAPPLQAVGSFVNAAAVDGKLVAGYKWGTADAPMAELLSIDTRHDGNNRGAVVRITCRWSASDHTCRAGDTIVRANAELKLAVPGSAEPVTFAIRDVRVDATWLTVKVRMMGVADALDNLRVGQVDTAALDTSAATAGSPIPGVTAGAILMSLGERQKAVGTYAVTSTRVQPGTALNAYNVISASVPVDALAAELLVPVESMAAGLVYRGVAIRPGNVLAFETKDSRVEALVVTASGS